MQAAIRTSDTPKTVEYLMPHVFDDPLCTPCARNHDDSQRSGPEPEPTASADTLLMAAVLTRCITSGVAALTAI
jgi:hypothetical protein